jgi:hypothetical protein
VRELWRDNRLVVLVALAVELLLLALWPLAARLDSSVDEVRPLFLDVQDMAELQYLLVVEGGGPEPLELAPGDQVDLGGVTFEPHDGVSVAVMTTDEGYCVTARFVDDPDSVDASRSRCWEADQNPALTAGQDPQDG